MLQLKILSTATKTQCSQINKYLFKKKRRGNPSPPYPCCSLGMNQGWVAEYYYSIITMMGNTDEVLTISPTVLFTHLNTPKHPLGGYQVSPRPREVSRHPHFTQVEEWALGSPSRACILHVTL